MRQHKRYTRLLAVLLGLSLVAAACGDDEDEPEGEGQEEEGQQQEGQGEDEEAAEDDPVAALHETGDADPSCTGEADDTLTIGALLPETGDLSFLGPPMIAGAGIAVDEINEAGGVNGQPIEYLRGDSGDEDPPVAPATVDGHLQANADVVLGAAASGISFSVIDTIVQECRIMFSPANTSPDFTTYDDDDLYFRTAPADILQGQVLAELALEDGVSTAAILARQDSYGQGLLRYIQEPFENGGGEVVVDRSYDPEGQDFSAEVQAVLDEDPDALFMVGFQESSRIVQDLFEQGFTPDEKFIYFVDGNVGNAMGETFDQPGALVGVRGTFPSAEVSEEFSTLLHERDPELQDEIYGPETYDAIVVLALAATQAGTDQTDEVARNINSVTREGTACSTFAECRDLIEEGEDINYEGVSGPLDFARPGEPTSASIAVQSYGEDNQIDPDATEYRDVELPE